MNEEDAIQPDVSQEEEKHPVLSERELAMQAIQDQLDSLSPRDEEAPPEPAATPEPEPVRTVRVKVDGEEKELPIEEVVKGYQKDTVASRRLEEAAKRQRELEAREAAIAERERQIQAQTVAPPPPVDEDDDTTAIIAALEEGDGETAAKLLKEALKKGRQSATPINAEEIAAKAAAEVEAKIRVKEQEREERERRKVIEEFVAANPLFAEPPEGEMHSRERVRGEYLFEKIYGPKWESGEISYREALDKTAEHVAREFAPPPAVNPREERKKSIDNIPVANGAKVPTTAKVETVDDVLTDMKKQRGQLL